MQRVEENGDWTLMCPNECPGLADVHGKDFEKLYKKYESEGKGRKSIKAQELWFKILESQIETGTPYMLYKDAANEKSNQKNLGTIKSSNLCTEIIEYTAPDEVAVCNLASIALPKFVIDGKFDHEKLFKVAYRVTKNLDKVIDANYYPVAEARNSNMRHRPIGIGVQGLADTFILLRQAFESAEAKQLNKDIFETIYYAALTASTAQILGNNECFEPYTSNIYTRRVLSGEFIIVNKHLLRDLVKLGIWDDRLKNKLMASNGSIQNIEEIPENIKNLYKTAWEISQKVLLDMAADRGAFIDQSQSLNIFMENANFAKLTSMHFYGWKAGLKTGMYYLRTKSATDAIKFTLDKEVISEPVAKSKEQVKVAKK